MQELIEKLETQRALSPEDWHTLLQDRSPQTMEAVWERARAVRIARFGNAVYIRGLIEFTNHCKNDCYYCGIRRSNGNADRYRLTNEEILSCCREGYRLGFRTFVLQGGEDPFFTCAKLCALVRAIKVAHPDCAVTLSVGERPREEYEALYQAGADRYLLRHETADDRHYRTLHPAALSPQLRKACLKNLKEIGYQVGCGFMVGSPGQTTKQLVQDMLFLQEFQPDMVGIGPFIPQTDTPLGDRPAGDLTLTLYLLGLVRLLLPDVLLPATTALGSIHPRGREEGILAGANVVMPNLSPPGAREKYTLYDNKLTTGAEAAESLADLRRRVEEIGYQLSMSRGDHPSRMQHKRGSDV